MDHLFFCRQWCYWGRIGWRVVRLTKDSTWPHKGAYHKLKDNVLVVLAYSGPKLVPSFEKSLHSQALKSLEKKGTKVILNSSVNKVGDGLAKWSTRIIYRETGEVTGRKELELPTVLTVWCRDTEHVPFFHSCSSFLKTHVRWPHQDWQVDAASNAQTRVDGFGLGVGQCCHSPSGQQQYDLGQVVAPNCSSGRVTGSLRCLHIGLQLWLNCDPPVLQCIDTPEKWDGFNKLWIIQWLQVCGLSTAPQFLVF